MAADSPTSAPPGARSLGPRRSIWLIVVAALALVGAGLAWIADGGPAPGQGEEAGAKVEAGGTGQETAETYVTLAPGQSAVLPPAPISGRTHPAAVWTGTEMVVWGGAELTELPEHPVADGAAFSPSSGQWRLVAPSPLSARSSAAVVWTGTEMVVWGGSNAGEFLGDGAAYNPATDSWRPIAPSPLAPAMAAAVAWTGTEMVIVGGLNLDGQDAAYDPGADTWRRLAPAPARPGAPYQPAVWTGQAMLLVTEAGTVLAHPIGSGGWTVAFDGSSRTMTPGFAPPPGPAVGSPPGGAFEATTAPPPTSAPGAGATAARPPASPPATGEPAATTSSSPPPSTVAPSTGSALATATPPSTAGPGGTDAALVPPPPGEMAGEMQAVIVLVAVPGAGLGGQAGAGGGDATLALTYSPELPLAEVLDAGGASVGSLAGIPAGVGPADPWQPVWTGREVLSWSGGERGVAFEPVTQTWRTFDAGGLTARTSGALVWADGVLLGWGGFVSRPDGTAVAAADGIILRP